MNAQKNDTAIRDLIEQRIKTLELDGVAAERARSHTERLRELDDGTVAVQLVEPVPIGRDGADGTRANLTVGRIRWKHLRGLDPADPDFLSRLADRLIEPLHAHDGIATEDDQVAVLLAVSFQLGKYQARATGPGTSR